MADVVLFGTGQMAEVIHHYIENDSDHDVVAFTLNKDFIEAETYKKRPVVPFEDLEKHYGPDKVKLLLPISYKRVNEIRKERYLEAKRRGYEFVSYISSKAFYFGTPVGENTIILEGNIVQPLTEIGNNVIMWGGNHLGHHSRIGDSCYIASHAMISGGVTVGEQCFVGVNATLRDNITIGRECVIGAGSTIVKDIPDYSVTQPPAAQIMTLTSDELKVLLDRSA